MKVLINSAVAYDEKTKSQVSVLVYSVGSGMYLLEASNKKMVSKAINTRDYSRIYKNKETALKNMINFDCKKLKNRY